jgi:hypothetical protein
MSAPPQAIAPNPHTNLLNVYIQIANKMGFQQQQNLWAYLLHDTNASVAVPSDVFQTDNMSYI